MTFFAQPRPNIIGTTPGTVAAGDDSRIVGAAQSATLGLISVSGKQLADWIAIVAGLQSGSPAAATLTSGEVIRATSTLSTALNGATILTTSGRGDGISIPAGSSGANAIIAPRFGITPQFAQREIGNVILVRYVATATVNFLAEKGIAGALRVEYMDGTVSTTAGTLFNVVQNGTTIIRDYLYTVLGNESRIAQQLQIPSTATAVGTAHQFKLTSASYQVSSVGGTLATTALDDNILARLDPLAFGVGRVFADVTSLAQRLNGAGVLSDSLGRTSGLTFPAGTTGLNSVLQDNLVVDPSDSASLAGRTFRFRRAYATTSTFTRTFAASLQVQDSGGTVRSVAVSNVINIALSTTVRFIEFTASLSGTEIGLRPLLQFTSATATSALESIVLSEYDVTIVATPSTVTTPAGETQNLGLRRAAQSAYASAVPAAVSQALNAASYAATKTVALSGGDYNSPFGMLSATTNASITNKYKMDLLSGTYIQTGINAKDYIDFIGRDRRSVIIDGSQPANTALAEITLNSTLVANLNINASNLTIKGANIRYPVHDDNSGSVPNRKRKWTNCHIEHLGNQAAIDYQTSLGASGTPSGVWSSTHAYGHGSSSGSLVEFEGCTLIGLRAALQFHTSIGFADASSVRVRDTSLLATNDGGYAVLAQPCGSGQNDVLLIENCVLEGDIFYQPDPWMPTTLAYQPANHCEMAVVGGGNSPAVFRNLDFGAALKIASTTTGISSSIAVSGSAVAVLMGGVTTLAGNAGVPGYVYGYNDIQETVGVGINRDQFITALGKRLGDCTTTNLVLTVSPDGGSAITITFNQNYTNATNASILSAINTALGSAAVASAYNVGARYRPSFTNEERRLKNTSTTTILMGMALAFDTNGQRTCRPMTSTDPLAAFAGVAWEDIYPSTFGRVKTSGWLPLTDVLRSGGAALSVNDAFAIDPAKPGYVVSASQPTSGILPVVRPSLGAGLITLRVGRL